MWLLDRPGLGPARFKGLLYDRLRLGNQARLDVNSRQSRLCCAALPMLCTPAGVPLHPGPVLQVSLASHKEILLDWLTGMLCLVPLGVAPYYVWRGWRASNPIMLNLNPEIPEPSVILHGIDVSHSVHMKNKKVLKAVEFAARAHDGQFRKTGQPYVSHCLETALIFEELLSPTMENSRAEPAFIAAILHDVLDDTDVTIEALRNEFEDPVPKLVQQISELSSMIQLLRRNRRMRYAESNTEAKWSEEEGSALKKTILKKMEEPLVLLIKLADRLHNMRTVFALMPEKRQSVARETEELFCTLAERLGLFALKAELEDLCFAVLKPMEFGRAHYDLQMLWHPHAKENSAIVSNNIANLGRATTPQPEFYGVDNVPVPAHTCKHCTQDTSSSAASIDLLDGQNSSAFVWGGRPGQLNEEKIHLGCSCALSSEVLTDKQCEELLSWVEPFNAVTFEWSQPNQITTFAQQFLREQTEKIIQEICLGSFGAGFHIEIFGRVKSLYSAHKKMRKKKLNSVAEVLDVLALRVIINDENQVQRARELCYILLSTVQRLWKPVPQELDDYIANPKSSGYQSLHTALIGPGNIPFEIQIRTSSMHEDAEYGSAAHWFYKENLHSISPQEAPCQICEVGQPVLRIQSGRYLDGVVVQSDEDGLHLLVAVHLQGQFPRMQGCRSAPREEYEKLLKLVEDKGWFQAGHGDFFITLERYVLCVDGAHHRVDHYGRREAKTVIRPIHVESLSDISEKNSKDSFAGAGGLKNDELVDMAQVQRMRLGLEYYKDVTNVVDIVPEEEENVFVLLWPEGKISCFPRGTTAADVLASEGWIQLGDTPPNGNPPVVNVNNSLVPEETVLRDGDFLVLGREKIKI